MQSGFNRRRKAGFNYKVEDSEMKAGAVRCCISTVPAASHSYQPFREITVLVCQGGPEPASHPLKSGHHQKDRRPLFILIVISILGESSHSLFCFVLVGHYPMGQRQLHFHGTSYICTLCQALRTTGG